MFAITITDKDDRGGLAVELKDILSVVGEAVSTSHWKLEGVEAYGSPAAEKLEEMSDTGAIISGSELMNLASEVSQIVDGMFSGFEEGSESPWITITAIDSSAYDVASERVDALEAIRASFQTVKYIPGMEPS